MRLALPVLLLAGVASLASAAAPTRGESRGWVSVQFKRADLNRDGMLSRGEVSRAVNQHFGRLSTGRNRITTNMWFNRLDGNRSNSISLGEAQQLNAEFWTRFDNNRDGRIGPRERQYAEAFLKNPAR